VLSVTEGDDKPLKYPSIFFKSELLILNKVDLLSYVPFDITAVVANARRVHPGMEVMKISCITGDGLDEWLTWLQRRQAAQQSIRTEAVV
jgi:hydrogenase nickel incorporation protein HypB